MSIIDPVDKELQLTLETVNTSTKPVVRRACLLVMSQVSLICSGLPVVVHYIRHRYMKTITDHLSLEVQAHGASNVGP